MGNWLINIARIEHEEIKKYILRTPVSFGGGRRVEIVAKELWSNKFPENFDSSKLSKSEEIILKNAQRAEAEWLIDRDGNYLF